jgi:hypothetical protein
MKRQLAQAFAEIGGPRGGSVSITTSVSTYTGVVPSPKPVVSAGTAVRTVSAKYRPLLIPGTRACLDEILNPSSRWKE